MADAPDAAVIVVLTTAPNEAAGEELANKLLQEHLIACVNIVPGVTSIYRWEGKVRRDTEVLMITKTTMATLPRLRDRIVELHPYDVPEVVVLPVPTGSDAYLEWVRGEIRVTS